MMEQIVFGEKQKVMTIDLETLTNSADYERGKRYPKSHYEIINKVLSIIEEEGLKASVGVIHIAKSGITYPKERELSFRNDIKTIHDTRGVIIENMVAHINFEGELADDDSCQSIAIGFNKAGIEFTFGLNIWVCANMNIFGDNHIKNHGKDDIPYEAMIDMVTLWIKEAPAKRRRDLAILEVMRGMTFASFIKETRTIIGHFNEMLLRDPNSAPLRQARITDVHRELITLFPEAQTATLYEIYQAFTDASTHQDVLENRMVNTAAIGKYFMEEYNVDDVIESGNIKSYVMNTATNFNDTEGREFTEAITDTSNDLHNMNNEDNPTSKESLTVEKDDAIDGIIEGSHEIVKEEPKVSTQPEEETLNHLTKDNEVGDDPQQSDNDEISLI